MIFASAAHAQTKTLHFGTQSVELTSDKRSTPALHVKIGDTIWYGFLAVGTAAGRLTFKTPAGDVYSLIAATNHTFSAILADFPQIWTWDLDFKNANPIWGNRTVDWSTTYHTGLTNMAVWPTYHVQATCSATAGAMHAKGNPVLTSVTNGTTAFASTERYCWCRLKQRSDGANGGWVFIYTYSSSSECAFDCPIYCAYGAATATAFRTALFNAFANP
ncbi:MAG: hypothetical protein FWG39_02965 [Alphaproteobacteria bacterium]|nr:hypothetical protein [Alphaproteobacteria bacterium]